MRKKIEIDLVGSKNVYDIFHRFYKAINCYYGMTEKESEDRIGNDNNKANWDAFSDNISSIKTLDSSISELNIVLVGGKYVMNNLKIDNYGLNIYDTLVTTILTRTDPSQRHDNLIVTVQVIM